MVNAVVSLKPFALIRALGNASFTASRSPDLIACSSARSSPSANSWIAPSASVCRFIVLFAFITPTATMNTGAAASRNAPPRNTGEAEDKHQAKRRHVKRDDDPEKYFGKQAAITPQGGGGVSYTPAP